MSTEWKGSKVKYEFKCKDGHEWEARIDQIMGTKNKKGSYCKKCFYNRRRFNTKDIENIVEIKNGKILTDLTKVKGNSNQTYIDIECSNGYIFKKRISRLKEGTWCRKCASKNSVYKGDRLRFIEYKNKYITNILKNMQMKIMQNLLKESS